MAAEEWKEKLIPILDGINGLVMLLVWAYYYNLCSPDLVSQ